MEDTMRHDDDGNALRGVCIGCAISAAMWAALAAAWWAL